MTVTAERPPCLTRLFMKGRTQRCCRLCQQLPDIVRNPLTEEIAVMRLFICKIKMIHCRNATMRVWIWGEGGRGGYICQLSVKRLAICQLNLRLFVSCQLNFFYFISFALKTRRKFNSLSSVRSTGLRTRACGFNLQVPYPRSNSGKRTFAYSAATLFNCLDTDLKQIACISPFSIIFFIQIK